jgi:hypothetical protein
MEKDPYNGIGGKFSRFNPTGNFGKPMIPACNLDGTTLTNNCTNWFVGSESQ